MVGEKQMNNKKIDCIYFRQCEYVETKGLCLPDCNGFKKIGVTEDILRECPFCGEEVDGTEAIKQNDNSTIDMIQCCNCGLSMFDTTEKGLLKTWNTRHQPKHETVEQWETRTGETYPKSSPVYINIVGTWYLKSRWEYQYFVGCTMIVANHHGKPND
jgi:hypothetical protein